MVLLTPHLIDAIAGTIPEDAWDWTSTPISWISAIDPGSTGPQTLENVIIHDLSGEGSKRGYIVFEILTTEQTYVHELNIVKNVIQKKLVEMEILKLEKRTPDNHPDKPLIKQAIETVSSIALAVNQKMEGIQHSHQLFQVFQQTLNCPPNLITEKRRCLLNIDAVDSRSVRYRLFLRSDLIMVVVYEGKRTMGVSSLLGNRPGGSGGSADGTAKQFRFLRWIDLLDIVDYDFYKIRIDPERNPRSLSTLTGTNGVFPLTVEYKIDSVQPGAAQKRGEFIRTLQNEISHAAKVAGP
ncbi:hypothetical protein HDU78_001526 [Chytriomyces hyalinus]|nr:hypothetical protein HDU78_001526 [Chytriomyces hyalinus]